MGVHRKRVYGGVGKKAEGSFSIPRCSKTAQKGKRDKPWPKQSSKWQQNNGTEASNGEPK